MDKDQALTKIEEISEILESSNKVVFFAPNIILFGVLVAIIPFFHYFLSFLFKYLSFLGEYKEAVAVFIYIEIFYLIWKGLPIKASNKSNSHPIIEKSFQLYRPIVTVIIGLVFVLISIKQAALIFPMIYILLGILYNLWGRFSNKIVLFISWSYILLGLVYLFCTQYKIPYLWIYFSSYLGLSYIVMGLTLNRKK